MILMTSAINNLVNKLSKMQWKIINNDSIRWLIEKITDQEATDAKLYKVTYSLRNKGHLISIKKNSFLVCSPNKTLDEEDIINAYYRELLKKHCQEHIKWPRYIGWIKALELHLQNYEISDAIEVVNTHKNAVEVVMFDKTVNYKTYSHQKVNVFSKIKKLLCTQKVWKSNLTFAHLELAILESLHNPSKTQLPLITEYIKKAIRKYKKTINLDHLGLMIANNKHHVGMNRLYQIAKSVDADFADKIHTLIKKYSFIMKAWK